MKTLLHSLMAGMLAVGSAFAASVQQAAWKTIPSWYLVSRQDRAINPELERFYAKRMGAKTSEVARLIEQAAGAVGK